MAGEWRRWHSTASLLARTLIVDGDESVLRLLDLKLSRAGFSVSTSRDGEDAYFKARAFGAHVVLVADSIGPLDSHSLVRAIAALPSRPAMIFLSSRGGEDDIEHALRAGCDDYVLKPFSPQELVHRIRTTLIRRRVLPEGCP
ncbi:MAG: response regulator transcription factor [Chloroflexi bacterium]|nr:response regulator transcription factor [Chloroflexota bacterium]